MSLQNKCPFPALRCRPRTMNGLQFGERDGGGALPKKRVGSFRGPGLWKALLCFIVLVFSLVATRPALATPTSILLPGISVGAKPLLQVELGDTLYGQPIAGIRFQGNRRVESEAMLLELESSRGELVTRSKLRRDLHRLWALGYFDDLRIEGELTPSGVILTYVVKERPTIRKIVVDGHDKVKLDDINEVLDLEVNEVFDAGKVKANVEKVKVVYAENGFFLAEVDFAVQPVLDAPGRVDVVIQIQEASEVIVRSIDFVGNKALTDAELRRVMLTKVGGYLSLVTKKAGGVYNRDMFAQDYSILRSYYADQGYLEADFKDQELALSPDRRFAHITIAVKEGAQFRIGSIRAKETVARGEEPLLRESVLASIIEQHLREGDVASSTKIQQIREAIERRYKDSGYAFPNVIPNYRQDREQLKLYLTYQIEKGPLVYVERVNILGNTKTADSVIRRELPVLEGDLYSETKKEGTEAATMRLGFFSQVVVTTERGSADDRIVLNVEVTERLTGTFQVGAGFSTLERFVLQAQISYQNFLGRGTTVQLVAQLSSVRRIFNLSYLSRHFLDSDFWFIFSVFNSSSIFPTGSGGTSVERQGTGFSTRWGYPIPRLNNLTAFVGYSLESVSVNFGSSSFGGILSPGASGRLAETALISNLYVNGLTSALTASLQYDTRDNILFPTSGQFHQLSGKFASKYVGSQNLYNRYMLDSRFYVPVIKSKQPFRAWLVFRTNFHLGYIHSSEPDGVPVIERFLPGGIFADGSMRGFQLRTLGPRIQVQSGADPAASLVSYGVGGNLLTALNLELEFMMIPPANIKGVVFMDIGNAFNWEPQYCVDANPRDLPKADPCTRFAFGDLRRSAGFGFRWQSPIGPLRFEWGFPLDRRNSTDLLRREDPVVFDFNVGSGF